MLARPAEPAPAPARHRRLAARRRRARLPDGRGRRHHPAHRIRPVDGPLGADFGRDPAARARPTGRPSSTHYRQSPQYQQVNRGMTLDRVQGHLLLGICPPAARPADRPRLRAAARSGSRGGGRSRAAMAGSSAACSRSARCRARSAGGWSPRAWSTGPRSATSASPSTCSPRLLIFAAPDLGRARPARARPRTPRRGRRGCRCSAIWALSPALPAIPVRRLCRRARGRLRLQQLAEDGRANGSRRETPMLEPFLRNFVDNPIVVQFVHRWLAFAGRGASRSGSASRAWLTGLPRRRRRC